jgi:hypothetical protein
MTLGLSFYVQTGSSDYFNLMECGSDLAVSSTTPGFMRTTQLEIALSALLFYFVAGKHNGNAPSVTSVAGCFRPNAGVI